METMLSNLPVLFIAAAMNGIFFIATQLRSKNAFQPARILLCCVIFLFSLSLTESALWWSGQIAQWVHFIEIASAFPFIYGPLVFLYFKASFDKRSFSRKDILHFVPFIIHFLYCSQFYFSSSFQKSEMLEDHVSFRSFFVVWIHPLFFIALKSVSLVTYAFLIYRAFSERSRSLKDIRAWFLLTLGAYSFYVLNVVFFQVFSIFDVIGGCADQGISTAMTVFIFLFSWFGYVQPKVFDGFGLRESLAPSKKPKYASSVLTAGAEHELYEKLQELMASKKLYIKNDLRLETLAREIGVARNSLSQAINNRSGMNFLDYINYWRIQEAKKLLGSTTKEKLNIIEIAYQVGFNNKMSFNKTFKKRIGLTPTEYRKFAGKETSA